MNSESETEPLESTPFSDTISESDDLDEDPDGYLGSHQRALSLLLEAMVALVVRLWLATIVVSTLMYFLRRIPVRPVIHHSGAYMSDREIIITTPSIQAEATPALFGLVLSESLSGPLLHVRHSACSEFKQEFPSIVSGGDTSYNTSVAKFIGLVERGGCPFDQKVYFMQQAGFKGVLIYNNNGENRDATVRMSAHSLGDDIDVFAGFVSRITGLRLLAQLRIPNNIVYITLSPHFTSFFTKQLIINGLIDMGILFVLVIATGTTFLAIGLGLNFVHNLLTRGELLAVETVHEASLIILAVANQQPSTPKLKSITFPTKTLVKEDLCNDWKLGGVKGQESCPICIEEYEVGDSVRELPCRHFFHDTCVDPWLLKHNRLCPVCKRDTLKKPRTIKRDKEVDG